MMLALMLGQAMPTTRNALVIDAHAQTLDAPASEPTTP